MRFAQSLIVSALFVAVLSQRSPYARRPVGYPELETTTDPLGNRFGGSVTTQRLPIEALGDADLVNRLSKLPVDKQPFWYINWKKLEEQRQSQQTYEQRRSPFLDDLSPSVDNVIPIQSQNVQQNQNLNNGGRSVRF